MKALRTTTLKRKMYVSFGVESTVCLLTCLLPIGYRNHYGASCALAGLQVSIVVDFLQVSRLDCRALYTDHKTGSLQGDLRNPLHPKRPKVHTHAPAVTTRVILTPMTSSSTIPYH